jgi:hypothetical protein
MFRKQYQLQNGLCWRILVFQFPLNRTKLKVTSVCRPRLHPCYALQHMSTPAPTLPYCDVVQYYEIRKYKQHRSLQRNTMCLTHIMHKHRGITILMILLCGDLLVSWITFCWFWMWFMRSILNKWTIFSIRYKYFTGKLILPSYLDLYNWTLTYIYTSFHLHTIYVYVVICIYATSIICRKYMQIYEKIQLQLLHY